jgi:hypothetical protein
MMGALLLLMLGTKLMVDGRPDANKRAVQYSNYAVAAEAEQARSRAAEAPSPRPSAWSRVWKQLSRQAAVRRPAPRTAMGARPDQVEKEV